MYLHKIKITNAGKALVILSTSKLGSQITEIGGIKVGCRQQNSATFGLLSLIDPDTGVTMNGDHPVIKQLQATLKVGDVVPGFKLSSNPVLNTEGEPTGMFWVEAD